MITLQIRDKIMISMINMTIIRETKKILIIKGMTIIRKKTTIRMIEIIINNQIVTKILRKMIETTVKT